VTGNNDLTKVALTVTIPQTASGPQGPTGQVNNSTPAFLVNGTPANFIFANLNGTISAWNASAGTTALVQATTPGASYTGLAIAQTASGPVLYAARAGGIDVFTFQPVSNGAFATPAAISARNLVPFNVQTLSNGDVAVTYAPAGRPDSGESCDGTGGGSGGDFRCDRDHGVADDPWKPQYPPLAAPWGISLATASFNPFANDLLIGNFSFVASEINAFDPLTGAFLGTIPFSIGSNCQAAFGPSASGPGAATGAQTPFSSPMESTARWTDCLAL
jgi:uncharacterized protein (TIGR03118 family)